MSSFWTLNVNKKSLAAWFGSLCSHLTPHFIDLTPESALGEFHLLVEENAGANQVLLHPPHLASAHVLILEGQLHRIECHLGWIGLQMTKKCSYLQNSVALQNCFTFVQVRSGYAELFIVVHSIILKIKYFCCFPQ